MSRRSKLIAKLDRERRAAERQAELEKLAASAKALKTREAGFARTPLTDAMRKTIKRKQAEEAVAKAFGPRYSLEDAVTKARKTHQKGRKPNSVKYSGEMAAREQRAKEQAELLKGRVGPVGNKMGDQYLTDLDLADMRKGLLRRRS